MNSSDTWTNSDNLSWAGWELWLNPCQDGLGHLFRGELSKYKQAFAWFWGVKKLARMVWGTFFQRIFTEGLPLNIHLYYSFRNHTTLQNLKIGPENRCPRVPVWVRGVQWLFGQCPNAQRYFYGGASLKKHENLTGLHNIEVTWMVCQLADSHSLHKNDCIALLNNPHRTCNIYIHISKLCLKTPVHEQQPYWSSENGKYSIPISEIHLSCQWDQLRFPQPVSQDLEVEHGQDQNNPSSVSAL